MYIRNFLLILDVVTIIVIYCRSHKEAPASDGTMTSLDASPEGTEPEIDHSSDQTNVRIKTRIHITGVTSYSRRPNAKIDLTQSQLHLDGALTRLCGHLKSRCPLLHPLCSDRTEPLEIGATIHFVHPPPPVADPVSVTRGERERRKGGLKREEGSKGSHHNHHRRRRCDHRRRGGQHLRGAAAGERSNGIDFERLNTVAWITT